MKPELTPRLSFVLLAASVFVALLVGHPGAAAACGGSGCYCRIDDCEAWYPCSQDCPCGEIETAQGTVEELFLGETTITPVGSRRAVIEASGFISFGMDSGDECGLAVGNIAGIEEIRSVKILDESGAVLRELPFTRSSAAGPSFAAEALAHGLAANAADWQGFFVEVLGEVPVGELFSIVLDAKLEKGVSLGLLAEQVRTAGLIGTGAANSDGTVAAGHHVDFRPLGATPVSLQPKPRPVPTRPGIDKKQ
jgi:hypothetical protein